MIFVTHRVKVPLSEISFTFARSGGPGGQNVNKVNSKAILRWDVATSPSLPEDVRSRFTTKFANRLTTEGELVLSSQKYRDQIGNTEDCIAKLKEMLLEVAERPVMRRETKPTLGSKVRRVESKRVNSAKKQGRRLSSGDF